MKKVRLPGGGLTDPVPPPLSDIEMARMWRTLKASSALTPAPQKRPRPWRFLGLGLAAALPTAALLAVLYVKGGAAVHGQAGLPTLHNLPETVVDENREIELPNGSRVILTGESKVRITS